MARAHNFQDLTGVKMHRLTFLRYVGKNESRNAIWRVRCECGVEFDTVATNVKNGHTRSCGCIRIERCKTGFKKFLPKKDKVQTT